MLVLVTSLLSAAAQAPVVPSAAGVAGAQPERAAHEAACAAAQPRACRRLGLLLLLTGEDVQGAIDAFATSCDQGDLSSCASLGAIATLAQDPARLLSADCHRGDAEICLWWAQTLGVEGAGQAYGMACQSGSAEGCWRRLQLHQQAVLPLTDEGALRVATAACAGGFQEACASLRGSN